MGFYALCPAHIECRQKHITTDVIIMLHVSAFLKKHCFEGLYKLIISYEIIALKSNLMRGCRAHSALGMQLIGWFLKGPPPLRNGKNMAKQMFQMEILECPQSLRECWAIKTVCTILKAVRNDDFQLNFGLHFIWDVYWCSHIQAWIFQVGSRTPSLDSKMCQFPWISLS